MSQTGVLNISLKILNVFGYDPLSKISLIKRLLKTGHLIACLMLSVLILLNFKADNISFTIFFDTMEAQLTVLQALLKIFVFMEFWCEIKQLLVDTSRFAAVNEDNAALKAEARKAFKRVDFVIRAFSVAVVGTCISYFYRAFFSSKKEMNFACYVPNKFFLTFEVINYIQAYYMIGASFIVTGFDALFMSLCAHVIVQVKIIKYRLDDMVELVEDRDRELAACVQRHLFIVNYVKRIIQVYSRYFLIQYSIALLSIGIQMFQFSDGSLSGQRMLKSASYGVGVLIQFGGSYCYSAEEVHSEFLQLTAAIYNSRWYEVEPRFARKLLFLLMATQKEIVFSAGGMFDINRATFKNVFQASISMFTLFRTMKTK